MKIKHFAGYGSVNAKLLERNNNCLVIRVSGLHEYGLKVNSKYDLYNWLVKKFVKNLNYNCIDDYQCTISTFYDEKINDTSEMATYVIRLKEE